MFDKTKNKSTKLWFLFVDLVYLRTTDEAEHWITVKNRISTRRIGFVVAQHLINVTRPGFYKTEQLILHNLKNALAPDEHLNMHLFPF